MSYRPRSWSAALRLPEVFPPVLPAGHLLSSPRLEVLLRRVEQLLDGSFLFLLFAHVDQPGFEPETSRVRNGRSSAELQARGTQSTVSGCSGALPTRLPYFPSGAHQRLPVAWEGPSGKLAVELVPREGFEPPPSGLGNRCPVRLGQRGECGAVFHEPQEPKERKKAVWRSPPTPCCTTCDDF
jgi:hypothetical protein